MAKPSDKFKRGKWVRVMPSVPTEKQLLHIPYAKRTSRNGTEIMYDNFAGGIFQIIEVSDGDFTVCLNVEGRRRWFDPSWLVIVEDPYRLMETNERFKEGQRQIKAADKFRDRIFKEYIFNKER